MARENFILTAISIALAAIPGIPRANAATNPGSLQMNIHVASQRIGTGASDARQTTGPVLAEERRPPGQAGSRATTSPPASEPPPVDDRSMPRGSPEAAHDLIGTMKRAGSKQEQKPK